MSATSRMIKLLCSGRARGRALEVLRCCASLLLVFSIVYTPIHLYLEPHSDEAEFRVTASPAGATAIAGVDNHDGDDHHHQRHPAAQHKLPVVKSERLGPAEMPLAPASAWVDPGEDRPQEQVFDFSGLSPPELSRCWQFIFRAALPVRAPSFLS